MYKWQKEILSNRIASEETILKEIKKSYKEALQEIEDKVASLLGRLTTEEGKINKTSIEYQLGYQKALHTQIKAILEQMNTQQFDTISNYLQQSYEDGFIGTMYDLQNQGIPIVSPIDEKQVVRAVKTNSKLSKDLWGSLAEDNSELQVQIRSEISRGISQGHSYSRIARQLAERMSVGYSKTARIVRTESHRITQEATLDAQFKAKETGADVVKQWDASLDRRTRSTHAQLDGKIVQVDEYFEIGGNKALHPSGFGVASLDINCRCTILQRAKWALDEEELRALEERAKYFGLDKAKDFKEYKEKYLEAAEEIADNSQTATKPKITLDNFPEEFKSNKKKIQNTELLAEYINSQENSNPKVVELYSKLIQMENLSTNDILFEVKFGDNNEVGGVLSYDGRLRQAHITLQDLTKNNTIGAKDINLHELGHLIDLYKRNDTKKWSSFTENVPNYKAVLSNSADGMSKKIQDLFIETKNKYRQIQIEQHKIYNSLLQKINDDFEKGVYSYDTYKKTFNKTKRERDKTIDVMCRNLGVSGLEDIYDALSGGKLRDNRTVSYGHGVKYYKTSSKRVSEIFANYMNLSITRPDLVELLREDKPELVEMLDGMIDDMLQ